MEFTVKVTDADGDTDTACHTIDITDGKGPSAWGEPLPLSLDDQNLADGTTPATPVQASGDASFTAGSDALVSFAFATDLSGLDSSLTWTRVSDILIEGFDGATKIVSLELTTVPASIAAGDTGSVTVTATLHDNFDSHPTFTADDLKDLGSVDVVATDIDGSNTTQTVTLDVSDDIPDVDFDGESTVDENGAPVTGTFKLFAGADGLLSGGVSIDVDGADVQTFTAAELADGQTITTSAGTLVMGVPGADGAGTWTFTPAAVSASANVNVSITLTDGDSDSDSDTHAIQVVNVNQPLVVSGAVTGVVEEEHDLPGGIDDETSGTTPTDLDADAGVNLSLTTNVAQGSFLPLVTGGIDGTLSFAFAALSGNPAVNTVADGPLTSDGKQVYFDMEGPDLIGYVNADGDASDYNSGTDTKIFTITLNAATGDYTFTLNGPVDHPIDVPPTEDAIAIDLGGRVTVTDDGGPAGDTDMPLDAAMTVIDDISDAANDDASVVEGQGQSFNVVFILDFSGSINNGELDTMLDAVRAAGQALFDGTSGDVQIKIVAFSTTATSFGPFSTFADFSSQIDCDQPRRRWHSPVQRQHQFHGCHRRDDV